MLQEFVELKTPHQCRKQRQEQQRAGSWVAGAAWIYQLLLTGEHLGNLPHSPPTGRSYRQAQRTLPAELLEI